jgi:hypothetical protein
LTIAIAPFPHENFKTFPNSLLQTPGKSLEFGSKTGSLLIFLTSAAWDVAFFKNLLTSMQVFQIFGFPLPLNLTLFSETKA